MDWSLVLIAVALLGVAAISQRLSGTPVTPAMAFAGFSVPLLFAVVAAADVHSEISGGRSPATLLLEEIGYGVLGGVVAGLLIAGIVREAGRRDLIAPAWKGVIPAAGAALAYGIAIA